MAKIIIYILLAIGFIWLAWLNQSKSYQGYDIAEGMVLKQMMLWRNYANSDLVIRKVRYDGTIKMMRYMRYLGLKELPPEGLNVIILK